MKNGYERTTDTNYRRIIKQIVYGKITEKYKITSVVRSRFVPQLKKKTPPSEPSIRNSNTISIRGFYIKNSQIDPGKKACITRNKKKIQVRWLNSSMLDLHVRYCIEEHKVSYTTFTRYRPFFCKIPKVTARNTCACLKHENFSNIVKVLHKHKILLENSVEQIVNNLVCEDRKNACLSRMCINCKKNQTKLDLNGICLADSISYDQWIRVTEERFDEKTQKNFKIIRTVKQKK